MYLSEIAPLQLRGTLGVFCSMGITGGVVVGQIVSLQEVFGTPDLWHFSLSFQLVFLIICTLPYRLFPESPKYLCSVASDRPGAMRELRKLCDSHDMALEELDAIEPSSERPDEKQTILSVLTDPKLLLPLVLVCAMQGGQQLSGINAVSFWRLHSTINSCSNCFHRFFIIPCQSSNPSASVQWMLNGRISLPVASTCASVSSVRFWCKKSTDGHWC